MPASSLEPPYIVSLDFCTSSVRAGLFDQLGRAAGPLTRRAYAMQPGPDGAVEADPQHLLSQAWECMDELLAGVAPPTGEIAAVAACTFASSLLALDESGKVVHPLVPYSDRRPAQEAAWLREQVDERAAHQRTGCPFHPSYWPARFLWLARHRPELLRPGVRWMTLGEYLAFVLFARTALSHSAAAWTGLLNRFHLDWDPDLLEILPVERAALSELVDFASPWQGLAPEYAARWPALAGVPWFPAVGDGAAANLGSGCLDASRACLTVGTSSALRSTLPDGLPEIPWGLWCYRVDRRRALLGGALSEGGNVYAWLRRTLNLEAGPELEAALGALPPDVHGLTFLPLLAGERSPGRASNLRGVIHGLSLATTPLEILRAGLEGVALRIGSIYRELRAALPADPQIVASGGALSASPAWLQIFADVLGRPLHAVPGGEEASARGAALLAFEALGYEEWKVARLEGWEAGAQVNAPDPARHALYAPALERQTALYDRLD